MGVSLSLQAYEIGSSEPSSEILLPVPVQDVLVRSELGALLPDTEAGHFLRVGRSRGRGNASISPRGVAPGVVSEAFSLLASVLAQTRSLDVLFCTDADSGEELSQVCFEVGGRRAQTQSWEAREHAEAELWKVFDPGDGPLPEHLPDLVLRGTASGIRRVGDTFRDYATGEIPIRCSWRPATQCVAWDAVLAFVASRPHATFRLDGA